MLDETVANATLEGFTALGNRINALADARLDSTLDLHRSLFYATIGIIILVALFIFRPMSDVILRKTDELMDARNSMAFLAVHDGLTGLHNRAFLTDHFDTLIKGAQRRDERMAVVQIDLDRFKQINERSVTPPVTTCWWSPPSACAKPAAPPTSASGSAATNS